MCIKQTRSMLQKILASISLSILLLSSVQADGLSRGSQLSHLGSVACVEGSSEHLKSGSEWVITAVKTIGGDVQIVLQKFGGSTRIVLQSVAFGSAYASLAVGQSVQVSSTAIGSVLTCAGQLLATVPNELGRSLLHQSSHSLAVQ